MVIIHCYVVLWLLSLYSDIVSRLPPVTTIELPSCMSLELLKADIRPSYMNINNNEESCNESSNK